MKRYLQNIILAVLILLAAGNGFGQNQLRTPYPIIFVHGIVGDNTTWSDPDENDIIDFLTNPAGNTPLQYGGIINVALDYKRDITTLNNTIAEDVHLFTPNPEFGDLYVINFDVHASGIVPHEIPNWGILQECFVTELFLSEEDEEISVTIPAKFFISDIIRIQNEFMLVTGINESSISVTRHILESQPEAHSFGDVVWDLSTESNQAAIAKQGYGLKLAIDAVKDATGADKVILVCHSMGGLAAREYIRSYYNNDVAKIVTIGTPHYGSNLTDLPPFCPYFIPGIDPSSDAVRDLRMGFGDLMGVYLFGGNESSLSWPYYSSDVNCDGDENDHIQGLNENYQHLGDMARTWIASSWIGNTFILGANDGIVLTESQYIAAGDTIMSHRPHCPPFPPFPPPTESKDINALIRGMDEPYDDEFAYEIGLNSITKGFITYGIFSEPVDLDLFKLNITNPTELTVGMLANNLSGITIIQIMNENLVPIQSTNDINTPMITTLQPGTYYINVVGNATPTSYQYPYTLNVNSTVIPPSSLVASPADLLEFYDVVVNESRDKVVTLSNNSTSTISVTNLEITGTDVDQFAFTSPVSFDITPSGSAEVMVSFNPTSAGEKTATFVITNTSTDAPVISISLHGNGVETATRTLVVNPDITYNYGNVTIGYSKNKTFKLKNTGSDPLSISNLSLSGMNEDNYSMVNPPVTPFDIQTGETKDVVIKFSPGSVGVKSVDFVMANNSTNTLPENAVTLYGNGKTSAYTGSDNNIVAYEYWFDNDYDSRVFTSIEPRLVSMLNLSIPTTELNNGLHQFHIRHKDEKGQWSAVITEVFHKLPVLPAGTRKIAEYEYWFDDDYSSKVNTPTEPAQTYILDDAVNTASLSTGLHSYHTRFKDDAGQWSSVVTEVFHKLPVTATGERKITSYEYWFDNDYASKVITSVAPQQAFLLNGSVEAISLPVGLHNFHLRFKDDAGQWSSVVSEVFYKLRPISSEPNLISEYRYWFDLDNENLFAVNLETPVNPYHLIKDINTCSLPSGDHTIHFQFKDIRQAWSSVVTDTFNIPETAVPVVTLNGSSVFCENEPVTLTSTSAFSYLWSNGENTQSIVVNQSGNYSVTTNDACGVAMTSEPIYLTAGPLPVVDIAGDGQASICIGSVFEPTAAAQNYGDLIWESSGDGTFSSTSSLTPVYTPGTIDIEVGTVTLTLTASAISPCTVSTSDEIIIMINELPTAAAGDDATIIENESFQVSASAENYSSVLWQTSGDGTFDDATLLNPVYFPGSGDIKNSLVSLSISAWSIDPCPGLAFDVVTLTIMRQQIIVLANGWNSMSSFVLPFDQSFGQMMEPISDNLVIAKNMFQVYWPEYGINTIGDFDPSKGYIVKLNAPSTLPVFGFEYQDKTVEFKTGWNILAVKSDEILNSEELVSQLGENLIIVTEIAGNGVIWPSEQIFSIPYLIPGKAYMVKVNNDCSFTFPE